MTLYEHEEIARKEGRAEGRKEGRAEGEENKAIELIPEFVKLGLPVEIACEKAGISIERYNELSSAN